MNDLPRVALDVETYRDYFMIGFMRADTGKLVQYEMWPGKPLDIDGVKAIMARRTTIGFNSNSYDLVMIAAACQGCDNTTLKLISDRIITQNLKPWDIEREFEIRVPKGWDHIDLIEVAPGQASLKIYGGRVHAKKMQDLPIEPDASIKPAQRTVLCKYNGNDLVTTLDLYTALKPQIELRETLTAEYGIDLRSKSDAQIAEAVLKHEIEKLVKVKVSRPSSVGSRFNYKTPDFIQFRSEKMRQVLAQVQQATFTLDSAGAVQMPKELADLAIEIGNSTYRMGIGGLHSSEKVIAHKSDDRYLLIDRDVASYYPNIILNCELFPRHLGPTFLKVYRKIVERRLAAKDAGDTVTADSLKITINGSFGKLGSKWSVLYSPDLMIQVTVTGQLALLMFIERLEENGIRVVSANTDGVVIKPRRDQEELLLRIVKWWEEKTCFKTEETRYKALYSRDVNSYVAVLEKPKKKGDTLIRYKGKGAFSDVTLSKNPTNEVCIRAAVDMILDGTPLEETIRGCDDIRQFVNIRTVKGGAEKDGNLLGKAIRWYYATGVDGTINYRTNGNTVPRSEGAKPLMELPEAFPDDVDYDWYVREARDLLGDLAFLYREPKLLKREIKEIEALI